MSKIVLPKAVTHTVVEEKSVSLTELTIQRIVDLPNDKVVKAFIKEIGYPIVLWEAVAYDAVGQWTDENVSARLLEIFSK